MDNKELKLECYKLAKEYLDTTGENYCLNELRRTALEILYDIESADIDYLLQEDGSVLEILRKIEQGSCETAYEVIGLDGKITSTTEGVFVINRTLASYKRKQLLERPILIKE